jgi:transposase
VDRVAGVKTKVFLFTLRLSYSGKAIHRAYATASQEAFLDGHRYAFEQLGGIPTVHIRYDNLKAAVSRVLVGRTRVESDRWVHVPVPLRLRRVLLPSRRRGRP